MVNRQWNHKRAKYISWENMDYLPYWGLNWKLLGIIVLWYSRGFPWIQGLPDIMRTKRTSVWFINKWKTVTNDRIHSNLKGIRIFSNCAPMMPSDASASALCHYSPNHIFYIRLIENYVPTFAVQETDVSWHHVAPYAFPEFKQIWFHISQMCKLWIQSDFSWINKNQMLINIFERCVYIETF